MTAPARDYASVRLCNCAACGVSLLGACERQWWEQLKEAQRAKLPNLVAGRVAGRPYCRLCLEPQADYAPPVKEEGNA